MFYRSIDGILTAFASLRNRKTEGNDSLRNALYNFGICALLFVLFGVLMILKPFLRPLLWAVLVAAVLFPMKKKLAQCINMWIDKVEREETPIIIGVVLLPFSGLEKLGEFIIRFTLTHIKVILAGLSSLVALRILIHFLPKEFFTGILTVLLWFHSIFGKIASSLSLSMLAVLVISYLITIKLMWSTKTSNIFVILSQGGWIFLVGFLCSYLGAFQIPVFIFLMIYGLVGMYYDDETNNSDFVKNIKGIFKKKEEQEGEEVETPSNFPAATPMSRLMKTKSHFSEMKSKMQLNVTQESEAGKGKGKDTPLELESNGYFKILFYACTATVLFKHLWIVFLSFIPISFYAIISLCKVLGLWTYIETQISPPLRKLKEWLEPRKYAIMPICFPGVIQLNKKAHKFLCLKLKSYADDISASIMIVFLIVSVGALSIFCFIQIYSETIAVAQLSGNLLNKTLTMRPELVESLPINMQNLNDVIDNAYQFSRGSIENYLGMS